MLNDSQFLIACALGLAVIIAIGVLKLAPFLSTFYIHFIGTFAASFAAHQPLEARAQAFSEGARAHYWAMLASSSHWARCSVR